jgi:hypothetical protein
MPIPNSESEDSESESNDDWSEDAAVWETNLAGHVSAAHLNAIMNMVSTYLRIPNYMQLISI